MSSELINSNVVIAAQQFNPTVFSQIWLLRNKILRKDDWSVSNFSVQWL